MTCLSFSAKKKELIHFRLWHTNIQKSTLCYCQHRCIQALCSFCISYNLPVLWRTICLSNKKAQCTYYIWGLSLPLQSLQALRLQKKVTVMKLHSNTTICIRFLYNSSSNPCSVLTGQRTPRHLITANMYVHSFSWCFNKLSRIGEMHLSNSDKTAS